MKDFIEKLVKDAPGAAKALGNTLCGRFVGQIADGFGDDPEVRAHVSLYLALRQTFPGNSIVAVPKMWERMVKRASDHNDVFDGVEGVAPEELAEWKAQLGPSERDVLKQALPTIMRILKEEGPTATLKAWYDIGPIGQHSLAVYAEQGLWKSVTRYEGWDSPDGAALREEAVKSVEPTSKLVTTLDESLKDELEEARSRGVRVAPRGHRQAA